MDGGTGRPNGARGIGKARFCPGKCDYAVSWTDGGREPSQPGVSRSVRACDASVSRWPARGGRDAPALRLSTLTRAPTIRAA